LTLLLMQRTGERGGFEKQRCFRVGSGPEKNGSNHSNRDRGPVFGGATLGISEEYWKVEGYRRAKTGLPTMTFGKSTAGDKKKKTGG